MQTKNVNKTIAQGVALVLLFIATWLLLSQIDWMKVFRVEKVTDKTEEKLGEIFLDVFKKQSSQVSDAFVINTVDSLINHICDANSINRNTLKIHVLHEEQVNAFALPNGHMIIFSALIQFADNQEELAGVIAHELAHIQLNHVMKKLVKEIGLSVLISMTTGGSGGEVVKEGARLLSSSAFDRQLEKEADLKAVEYLVNANINPLPFADFLYKLSGDESDIEKYLKWVSTHPSSKQRAEYVVEQVENAQTFESVVSDETWQKLQSRLSDND